MNETIYRFEAVLQKVPDLNGAYVEFPYAPNLARAA